MALSEVDMIPSRRCSLGICLFLGLFIWSLGSHLPVAAAAEPSLRDASEPEITTGRKSFSFYLENDIIAGDDKNYTNGLKVTFSRFGLSTFPDDAWAHKWLYPAVKWLGIGRSEDTNLALTLSVGQNIYTPEDIEKEVPDEDDRPYAGITYFELGYHQRENHQMDTLEFYAGIVGPNSYAEEIQTSVHKLLGGKDPKGWDYQLKNEPVLGVIYEYKKKIVSSAAGRGMGYDIILNTGGGIGNAMTYYNIGGVARWGINIPNDFGTFPIRPASTFTTLPDVKQAPGKINDSFGIHLFLSANGRAMIRDIFLDGNTFSNSRSVDKKPVVGDFMGGIGLITGSAKVSLAYVYQTQTFETQDDPQVFGSFNVSMVF